MNVLFVIFFNKSKVDNGRIQFIQRSSLSMLIIPPSFKRKRAQEITEMMIATMITQHTNTTTTGTTTAAAIHVRSSESEPEEDDDE